MAKLTPEEIRNRIENIEAIRLDYTKKIRNVRDRERKILIDSITRTDKDKLAEVARSIRQNKK